MTGEYCSPKARGEGEDEMAEIKNKKNIEGEQTGDC